MANITDWISIFFHVKQAGFDWGNFPKTALTTLDLSEAQAWNLDVTYTYLGCEQGYARDFQTTLAEIDRLIAVGHDERADPGSAQYSHDIKAGAHLGLACAKLLHWIHVGDNTELMVPAIQANAQSAIELFTLCNYEKDALWSRFIAELTNAITRDTGLKDVRNRGAALGAQLAHNLQLSELAASTCLRLVRKLRNDTSRLHASRDILSLTRVLSLGIGLCGSISMTITLAQMHATLGRLYTDINDTTNALKHLELAYDLAITAEDSRIGIDSYNVVVDGILDSYGLLNDEDGLSGFYDKLNRTWTPRFKKDNNGTFPLGNWIRQREHRLDKIKYRKAIRANSFYNAQKLVAARFKEALPDNEEIAIDEWYYRSNLGMNYGDLKAAREACEKLDAQPFDYFARRGKWEESPQHTWRAFEVCIERTAFENSVRFFERLRTIPGYLNLSGQPSEHEPRDYQKLVQIARLYIFQERWREAFALLSCSCYLIMNERERISSDYLRSRHFDNTSIEKAFDWTVWVCLHFYTSPNSPTPKELDVRAIADDWAHEGLRYAEMGRARGMGDFLEGQRSLESVATNQEEPTDFVVETNVFKRLSAWLDPETLIVHMTLCDEGFGLICCDAVSVHHAEWIQGLPGFGRWDVQRLTSIMQMVHARIQGRRKGWEKQTSTEQRKTREVIDMLSESIVTPIKNILKKRRPRRICFVPAGQLLRVPFAALELEAIPLVMQYTVYQVPSLSILESLFRRSAENESEITNISVVMKASHDGTNMVTLLENVVECVDAVNQTGGLGHLDNAVEMSQGAFLERFQQCDILHVGTHGVMDYTNPSKSCISLQQDVTVTDLDQVTSKAKFVFFSACLTGLGHSSLSDDLTGFQTQVLRSGALAFAGLLWSGDALASLFFSHFLYEGLMACPNGTVNLADVFTEAQRKLRALKRDEAHTIILNIERGWNEFTAADLPPDIMDLGRTFFECYEHRAREDFEHIFFWAPYTFIGYPVQVCRSDAGSIV